MDDFSPVRTFLPADVDFDAPWLPPKWRDYAKFVVGGLYLRRHLDRSRGDGDFYPLSSKALKDVLPAAAYRDILDALVDGGVVERELNTRGGEGYRVGHSSKGFRLTEAYRNTRFRAEWLRHNELVRRVHALRRRQDDRLGGGVHSHLRRVFDRVEVAPGYPDDSLPLRLLAEREPFFSVCRQGRFHSPVTSLKRELRRFLTIDGQPLRQIDVVNSQPLLLGLTLKDRSLEQSAEFVSYQAFLAENFLSKSLNSKQSLFKHTTTTTNPDTIPYVGGCSDAGQDFARYVELCLEGRFYEFLAGRTDTGRDEAKDAFCLVAFGFPAQTHAAPVGRALRHEFPRVWQQVCQVSSEGRGALARLLQTVESYVVVYRSCGEIARRYPHAPLLTLHDSLVTDDEHLGPFGEILKSHYSELFGVVPQLKSGAF